MDELSCYIPCFGLAILEIGRNHLLFPATGPSNSPKKAIIDLGNNILLPERQKKVNRPKIHIKAFKEKNRA